MINLPIKPTNSRFTDKQWQSIYDSGDNILISASAGSGKTTVLVERVIQKIKSGVHVDELLIVTYTEAASKEMKQRIQQAIQQAITSESDSEQRKHLALQLSLLPTATISTLHSFCLRVIQKYYYLIHIDPVFRMMTDETEILLLKEDVWDELREELYGEKSDIFYQLTANFSNDRNDYGFMELIFSIHLFASANPDPFLWLDNLVNNYNQDVPLVEMTLYKEYMKKNIIDSLMLSKTSLDQLIKDIEGEPEFAKTLSVLKGDQELVLELLKLLENDQLDLFYSTISHVKFATIRGPSKKTAPDSVMEEYAEVKKKRDKIKLNVQEVKKRYFKQSPEDMVRLMKESKPLVEELIKVTKRFMLAFKKEKDKRHVLDFNDLEHLTLEVLRAKGKDGWQESEASTYYRSKFSEVLVDEYQDINRLQESILYWLRQVQSENGNLFMVGDVKQSIYAFRLADPTLFIEKYEKYATEDDGRRIILAENFRSRNTVLDFTNLVFEQLMDRELGQINYDESAALITGNNSYPESDLHDTEILIYEKDVKEVAEDELDLTFKIEGKTEGELRIVAEKIQQLIKEKFPIYDKKENSTRPIEYSDIVLLSPTKKNNLEILDLFKSYEIPVMVNDTQNYFQATEIRLMMSLLQLIDNPYQDIPMAAVLRSPIIGIKENDMVDLKMYNTNGYYYDAIQVYLKEGNTSTELYQKIKHFNDDFTYWRELSRRKRLVDLIWKIYQDTDLLNYVAGMPSGEQRQANLHALYNRATAYEEMSFKGLFQFVRFIEKMQVKNKDLAEAASQIQDIDCVRVMTIHASKGLEFPVVFLLDMTKQFNLMELNQQSYIFDENLGIGIKYLDQEERLKYDTLPYNVIREHKRKKMLAEEMRKLYVGLTRAEEKLYLVGTYKNKEDMFKKWSDGVNTDTLVLPTASRLSKKTLMDWVGMTLIRHSALQKAYPEIQIDFLRGLKETCDTFSITFFTANDLIVKETSMTEILEQTDNTSKPKPQLLKKIVNRLDYSYPEKDATKTASYQSVSEVKRLFDDPDVKELPVIHSLEGANRLIKTEASQPKFLSSEKKITAAEVGSAVHLVMQLLSLEKKPTSTDIKKLINNLASRGVIKEEVAKRIRISMIANFFATDFGKYLVSHAKEVSREQPFSLLLPAADLYEDYETKYSDTVLIHGIIDGFIETPTELILYDFKTDYLPAKASDEQVEEVVNRYKGQMRMYKKALEEVKQRPVTQMKLVLLQVSKIIDIE